jgi:hypothetical protein
MGSVGDFGRALEGSDRAVSGPSSLLRLGTEPRFRWVPLVSTNGDAILAWMAKARQETISVTAVSSGSRAKRELEMRNEEQSIHAGVPLVTIGTSTVGYRQP